MAGRLGLKHTAFPEVCRHRQFHSAGTVVPVRVRHRAAEQDLLPVMQIMVFLEVIFRKGY